MSILTVTYVGDGASHFDRNYYDTQHIPLVERIWSPFGLERAEVFYPADTLDGPGVVALCLCHFADRDGLDRALAAPESAAATNDVTNFTDLTPLLTLMARA